MKPTHRVMFVAGLLVLAAILWAWLTRAKPSADWLQVEAPTQVSPGETITIRVTPLGVSDNLLLNVDLHGTTQRHHPLRLVSHGRPQRIGSSRPSLEYHLSVPLRPDLASIHAIIYLSPSGGWSDRSRLVHSDPIPVLPGPASVTGLRPLSVHDQIPDPEIPRRELTSLRYLLSISWLFVAVGLGLRRKSAQAAGPNKLVPGHVPLLTASLAIAFAELLRLEPLASDVARKLAYKYDFYDERLLPQQIAILLLVVGMITLAVIILIRSRQRSLVLGLLAHATIAAAAVLSLHEADALLYATVLGQPAEQLGKLLAVCLALWGLRASSGERLAPPPSSSR